MTLPKHQIRNTMGPLINQTKIAKKILEPSSCVCYCLTFQLQYEIDQERCSTRCNGANGHKDFYQIECIRFRFKSSATDKNFHVHKRDSD